jgi:hypothetical protein
MEWSAINFGLNILTMWGLWFICLEVRALHTRIDKCFDVMFPTTAETETASLNTSHLS